VRPRSTASIAGVSGLRDEGGDVRLGQPVEGGDDRVVDAAGADGRVAEVDHGVPGRVQGGESGSDSDGFAGADSPVMTPGRVRPRTR
jgi:hypothetical protein